VPGNHDHRRIIRVAFDGLASFDPLRILYICQNFRGLSLLCIGYISIWKNLMGQISALSLYCWLWQSTFGFILSYRRLFFFITRSVWKWGLRSIMDVQKFLNDEGALLASCQTHTRSRPRCRDITSFILRNMAHGRLPVLGRTDLIAML